MTITIELEVDNVKVELKQHLQYGQEVTVTVGKCVIQAVGTVDGTTNVKTLSSNGFASVDVDGLPLVGESIVWQTEHETGYVPSPDEPPYTVAEQETQLQGLPKAYTSPSGLPSVLLDCTVCGEIHKVEEMYTIDACSEKCQNQIL